MSASSTRMKPAQGPLPRPLTELLKPNGSSPNGRAGLPRARRKGQTSRLVQAAVFLGLTALGVLAARYLAAGYRAQRTDLLTHPVAYERLQVTVVERGTLEAAQNKDVICQVKAGTKGANGATMIRWVIEDGTPVKRGQLLVELDDSGFHDQHKVREILADQARAAWVTAEEHLKIVLSQNHSDIQTAQVNVKLAEIDLEKYLKGDYQQTVKDIQGRLSLAESDLEMRRDRTLWTERMVRLGYLTASQARTEQTQLQSAELNRSKILEERRVLDQYTAVRTKVELQSKVEEAQRALDRVRKQAVAKEVQADADRQTKRFTYDKELAKLREIEAEIRKCRIVAPQDGLVIYHVSEQSRSGSGSQQGIMAQGEPVREGQLLMRIPNLANLQVNTKVHEALMSRVRGEEHQSTGFMAGVGAALLTPPDVLTRVLGQLAFADLHEHFQAHDRRRVFDGQKAQIRLDAFPDRVLCGRVKSVATVASQQDWWSSDVKVYQTLVSIDDEFEGLRPGMSAEVTILTGEQFDHVLAVPVQAFFGTADMGKKRNCFVLTPDGPEQREVIVGLSNEKMVEIEAGLAEGEEVVLNPRTLLAERRGKRAAAQGESGAGEPSTNRRQSGSAAKKARP